MNKNLKPQILELRNQGKTIREIKMTLNCSYSTISYHLYPKTKISTKNRINKEQRKKYNLTPCMILYNKYNQFFRMGHREHKFQSEKVFTFQEFQEIIKNNPKCYLTGENLDFLNTQSFSLDHKIPTSKGGDNSKENLGICSWKVNKAKNDMTPNEFIELCKQVLINQGYTIHGGRNGS